MTRLATLSTLFTVSAATGFLMSAILTDNGAALFKAGSDVVTLDPSRLGIEYSGDSVQVTSADETAIIDRIITGAIKRPAMEPRPVASRVEEETVPSPDTSPVLKAIESGKTVIVQPGDTLYKISRQNNISVSDLAEINALSEPFVIRPGQKLVVVR